MTLIEKRFYGTGVTDANRLAEIRSYRDQPNNQYMEEAYWDEERCAPGESEPDCNGWWMNGHEPDEDEIGWTSVHEYDWRMREVWVTQTSETDPNGILGQTAVWYDNRDRVRFTIEYGDSAGISGNGSLDPRLADAGDTEPSSGSAFFAVTPRPFSVVETIYNDRGQAEAVRNWYWDDDASTAVYTTTLTFFDHRGKPLETHSPNSPVYTNTYDAIGRQIASATWADDTEITRTESVYEEKETKTNVRESIHYERKDGTTGDLASNCVKTYTHTWYDKAGKVTATANWGTNETTNDTFVTGTEPTYDPNGPPARASDGPLITNYEYDDAGRQSCVVHPDGSATFYEYDDLGRLLMTTESESETIAAQTLVRSNGKLLRFGHRAVAEDGSSLARACRRCDRLGRYQLGRRGRYPPGYGIRLRRPDRR